MPESAVSKAAAKMDRTYDSGSNDSRRSRVRVLIANSSLPN